MTDAAASPDLARAPGAKAAATVNSPELVAEQLRRAILRGDLVPGEHVRQPDWAEQLGVSRAVLREAFKILTGQRLLRHSPQAGYFVAKLNASEMAELYRLRMFIEEEVLRSIRWPAEEEIVWADEQLGRYRTLFLAGNVTAAMDTWRVYMEALFDLSPLKFMVSEAIRLWEMASPYRMVGLTTQLIRDPELLGLEGLRQKQIEALREHNIEALVRTFVHDRQAATDTGMLLLYGTKS